MKFEIFEREKHVGFKKEILNMLKDTDGDFFPPLSSRSSTTQSGFNNTSSSVDGISLYYEEMMRQKLVIAHENGDLAGFVSFKENYSNDVISGDMLPNIYISTLIVKSSFRGRRLTKSMYEMLFELYRGSMVFTRTWSLNSAHIAILAKFGFETYKILKDDRGEGIDTVYFYLKNE